MSLYTAVVRGGVELGVMACMLAGEGDGGWVIHRRTHEMKV